MEERLSDKSVWLLEKVWPGCRSNNSLQRDIANQKKAVMNYRIIASVENGLRLVSTDTADGIRWKVLSLLKKIKRNSVPLKIATPCSQQECPYMLKTGRWCDDCGWALGF